MTNCLNGTNEMPHLKTNCYSYAFNYIDYGTPSPYAGNGGNQFNRFPGILFKSCGYKIPCRQSV